MRDRRVCSQRRLRLSECVFSSPAPSARAKFQTEMAEKPVTAKRYRERAAELRAEADSMKDENKRMLLRSMADNYEQLAKTAEKLARES